MTTVLLILAALVLPATMLVLSISVNDFEKSTRTLSEALIKRYTYVSPLKASTKDQAIANQLNMLGKK